MDADPELDSALGRQAGVALYHSNLQLHGTANGVDHAAKLDEHAIARAFHYSAPMNGNGRIDEIAA